MEPIRPVNHTLGLSAILEQVVVCSIVHSSDLVTGKDDSLNGPIAMLNIIDRGSHRRDDAKVVAGTLKGPPEVGFGIDGLQLSVGEDDVHGHELIGDEAVMALKPAVATAKSWAHQTDTFACSGYYSASKPVSVNCFHDGNSYRKPRVVGLEEIVNLPVCFPAAHSLSVTALDRVPPPIVAVLPSLATWTESSWSR